MICRDFDQRTVVARQALAPATNRLVNCGIMASEMDFGCHLPLFGPVVTRDNLLAILGRFARAIRRGVAA